MPFRTKTIDKSRRDISIGSKDIITTSRLIYHLIGQVKKGFSPLVLIVGERGMGKSFAACWLAYILMNCFEKKFLVKKNCIYTLEQAIDFIYENKKEILVLDEMIEMGFRREWQSKAHHNFYKVLVTQRIKQHIYLMILPMANDLDKIFAKNVSFVCYMKRRGLMRIYKVPRNYTSFTIPDLEEKIPFETITIKMSDVPKKIWKEYQIYSEKAKDNIHKRIQQNVKSGSILKSSADKIIDMLESDL